MTITGDMYISKKTGFYTTLKDRDDNRCFLTVGFRKGAEPEDGGKFQINEAFLTCYAAKNGDIKPKLMVLDYEAADEKPTERPVKKTAPAAQKKQQYIDVEDGELPF